MTDQSYAFAPLQTQTVSLSATSTSSTVALPAATIAALKSGAAPQLQIYNAGPNVAFINIGAGGLTALVPAGATPGDYPGAAQSRTKRHHGGGGAEQRGACGGLPRFRHGHPLHLARNGDLTHERVEPQRPFRQRRRSHGLREVARRLYLRDFARLNPQGAPASLP